MRIICLTLLFVYHCIYCDVSANKEESVAVVPFQVEGNIKNSKIFSHGLPDIISHRLSKVHNLKVLERLRLGQILQEVKLQECGITSEEINSLGNFLEADIIITASVHKLSSQIRFHVRGVRVRTGEIVFSILKYFNSTGFYDFNNLEHILSAAIIKALRPEFKHEIVGKTVITNQSIESFIKYCEGLYYFDMGMNDKSKECFKLSSEMGSKNLWVREVRKRAQRIFRELGKEK